MLVLGIIIAIIFLVQTDLLADIIGEEMDWKTCELSMYYAHLGTKTPLKTPSLACPRFDHLFEKETPDEISKVIAEEMVSSVGVLGKGGLDFTKGNVFKSSKNCVIFATYRFKEYEDSLILVDWLKANNVGFDKTYYEYFEEVMKNFKEKKTHLALNLYHVIFPSRNYYLYAVNTGESYSKFATTLNEWFVSIDPSLLEKVRPSLQKELSRFLPGTAKESYTEEEIEAILKTTRLELSDWAWLKENCNYVYSPKTKKFMPKEEYERLKTSYGEKLFL